MVMITKKDFESYAKIQGTSVTNMFNVSLVGELTGLPKEKLLDIMKNYEEYEKKFGGVI